MHRHIQDIVRLTPEAIFHSQKQLNYYKGSETSLYISVAPQ